MNFFHHKGLGNHLLQLCPKVVKHPVYITWEGDRRHALRILAEKLKKDNINIYLMEIVCSSVTAWCEGSCIMGVRFEERRELSWLTEKPSIS